MHIYVLYTLRFLKKNPGRKLPGCDVCLSLLINRFSSIFGVPTYPRKPSKEYGWCRCGG